MSDPQPEPTEADVEVPDVPIADEPVYVEAPDGPEPLPVEPDEVAVEPDAVIPEGMMEMSYGGVKYVVQKDPGELPGEYLEALTAQPNNPDFFNACRILLGPEQFDMFKAGSKVKDFKALIYDGYVTAIRMTVGESQASGDS